MAKGSAMEGGRSKSTMHNDEVARVQLWGSGSAMEDGVQNLRFFTPPPASPSLSPAGAGATQVEEMQDGRGIWSSPWVNGCLRSRR